MIKLKEVSMLGHSALTGDAIMLIKAYFSPRSLMLGSSLRNAISNLSLKEFLIVHDLG